MLRELLKTIEGGETINSEFDEEFSSLIENIIKKLLQSNLNVNQMILISIIQVFRGRKLIRERVIK